MNTQDMIKSIVADDPATFASQFDQLMKQKISAEFARRVEAEKQSDKE